jgi:glycosyl hydrolase family 99
MWMKAVARLASLLVVISLVFGTHIPVSAAAENEYPPTASLTFTPVADASAKAYYPTANFGKLTSLRTRSTPVVHSYLRFNVSGLNSALISSAKLRLYALSDSTRSVAVHPVTNDTWGETTITYNNAPAIGGTLSASLSSFTAGTWITLDVSSYVKKSGMYSLALTSADVDPIDFASREAGAYAPRLVVKLSSSTTGSDWQPSFPIRAAFYYPWFPQAWKQQGIYPYTNYNPNLGFYSSADSSILQKHIAMMQYAHIGAGIASWWGQGSQTDSKIPGLLGAASGTNFRWALYYEMESQGDPTISQIQSDLAYIRDQYGGDSSYLRVNGRFVVFVYADAHDACGMADRWKKANTVGAYVVLKVFPGFAACASQPDDWHQYSPAVSDSQQGMHSYSISPGFWLVGQHTRLDRDATRWKQSVKNMIASGARWQLITTFNEWGEGTAVEPAQQWPSTSGRGQYLDALHYNGSTP